MRPRCGSASTVSRFPTSSKGFAASARCSPAERRSGHSRGMAIGVPARPATMAPGGTPMASRVVIACVVVATMLGSAARARAETIRIPTLTIERENFLRGVSEGKAVTISAELTFPEKIAGPVPAVILVHGGSGVPRYNELWAREARGIGLATLMLDSFDGRAIPRLGTQLE